MRLGTRKQMEYICDMDRILVHYTRLQIDTYIVARQQRTKAHWIYLDRWHCDTSTIKRLIKRRSSPHCKSAPRIKHLDVPLLANPAGTHPKWPANKQWRNSPVLEGVHFALHVPAKCSYSQRHCQWAVHQHVLVPLQTVTRSRVARVAEKTRVRANRLTPQSHKPSRDCSESSARSTLVQRSETA